ncbi:putative Late nodulin [Medicago truncatula]|uniref:Nodule Cysteine-Rich (NCR) secreted peptide n=1 Tax=Medicago truncatula TaxID=3880 RepID=A0A072VS71_MEDTR|nr:Nodule Cysteine-Rich (NCR) secreted peptide [Medicago truncatula]RHN78427.1 putative Late nodulin [Medicago truncatula]
MVEIQKLVYVLILFLSIFLEMIVSNCTFIGFQDNPCKTDKDCRKVRGVNLRCRNGHCVMILQ